MKDTLRFIAFDADDTLWDNEPFFRETEQRFIDLLTDYGSREEIEQQLFAVEMQNMDLYGYGVKAFMLSMVEAALRISKDEVSPLVIKQIVHLGKEQLHRPVCLLDGVREVLGSLQGKYQLLLATKGDLLDQERKLEASGLRSFFHHIEIMSDKTPKGYERILQQLGAAPEELLMIGNSLRSDILPPLELGCYAIHVPYHTVWAHEEAEAPIGHPRFRTISSLFELENYV